MAYITNGSGLVMRKTKSKWGFGDDSAPTDDSGGGITGVFQQVADDAGAENVEDLTSSQGLSAADFNCTRAPGVCKPNNFAALHIVETLQNQCNRVAQVKGFAKVGADGDLGPGTAALVVKVMSAIGGAPPGTDAASIAPFADILSQQIQAAADAMGAPGTVSGPALSAPPTIVSKSGKTIVAPPPGILDSVSSLFTGMSSTQKVVLAGIGAGLVFAIFTSTKKARARSSRR